MIFKSFLFHAFHALDLGFLFLFFLAIFWGFWVFFRCEYYGLGYVNLILYDHALHPQCIITMFHAYLDVCDWLLLLSAARFGLGDPHDALKFSCHMFMYFSCIRSFLIYLGFWNFWVFFFFFWWNIWVGFCESDLIWPCIASLLHYNNVPCIFRCVWLIIVVECY